MCYTVTINDTFYEWSYKLCGSDEYSIQDIINLICEHSDLINHSAQQSNSANILCKLCKDIARNNLCCDCVEALKLNG